MDDDTLVSRVRKGDRAAINALLERHLDSVYRFVSVKMGSRHPDLDDVVQETLIGASRSISTLRAQSDAQVAGWLLSIARHKVVDHLRSSGRRRQESLDGPIGDNVSETSLSADDRVIAKDRAERIRRLLGELTPEQEEVLILRFVLGFGIAEVAEMTHRPEGAVKSMQHRALASLHKKLGSMELV